tara:strand:- start:95 stop:445 length:351 start_codon:yes stop_codon:yes gene_type:complete
MKIIKIKRSFKIKGVNLSHVADIKLKNDNFITFIDGKKQIDFTKKDWGYYPFPSINSRLKRNSYKVALVMNKDDKKLFILIVDKNRVKSFIKYIKKNKSKIIMWFDEKGLKKLVSK